MARTAVTPAQGARNAGVTPTSTTINSTLVTNGVTIANAGRIEDLVIRVANTDGSALAVTIRAGDSLYPAVESGLGDLAVTVAATSGVQEIARLESARYQQSDGSLSIDFATGFTGTLETMYLP
jgi:hypothetical protein